jgi:glycosyltransferase involved in cell wall biosynthesis
MTSDHEGLPMALLEAMALGIPIVAHAIGGIPKLLDYGASGILVHEHSSRDYAHEVYKLLRNPDLTEVIVKNAMDRVKKEYSAARNAQAILLEYIDILDTKRQA